MTKDQAKRLSALTNVIVEAEREYLRAKLKYSSIGRRDKWSLKVKDARKEFNQYLDRLQSID